MGVATLAVLASLALGCQAMASHEKDMLNPISRVAVLMQNMAKKVEADGKAEQELFDKYECWYKWTVASKKTSTKRQSDRIQALETFIRDIESGSLEFTGEREALEKEVGDLTNEIAANQKTRDTEVSEYEAAKDEMEKAIASLTSAVEVLGEATKGSALVQRDSLYDVSPGLKDAIELGQSFVPKAQASFLTRAIAGADKPEEGEPLFEKGNDQNMKYKKSSTKIQEILADMLETFKDNLDDANKMERQKSESFDKLSAAKKSQLKASDKALAAGSEEADRKNLAKEESLMEKKMLSEAFDRDTQFIKDAEEAYKLKSEEWSERCRLRQGEIAAITEAAAVLTSDEGRDASSKSMTSQGYLLLQGNTKELNCLVRRAANAKSMIRKIAIKRHDMRLAMLSLELHAANMVKGKATIKGHFDKVEKSIEEMVSDLHRENDEDLDEKEHCEDDRMENTNIAKKTSQQIDDVTARIARKVQKVAAININIKRKDDNVKALETAVHEAQVQRTEQNRVFEANKADDEAAKSLVDKSMVVLKKFYEDEGLSFAQVGVGHRHQWALLQTQHSQAPYGSSAGGEAPPPPPATWSEPYGGAQGENDGIQAIMDMIKDDIDKDIRVATEEEDQTNAAFEEFKGDNEAIMDNLKEQIATLEIDKADNEEIISAAKSKRKDKKAQLEETMTFLRTIAPGCDFIAVNFQTRKDERAAEIDGLLEAKTALHGGSMKGAKATAAEDAAARTIFVQDGDDSEC